MASMEVAAAARAAAQQRPHNRWAAEFAGMSLRDHPQHVSGCGRTSVKPALACSSPGGSCILHRSTWTPVEGVVISMRSQSFVMRSLSRIRSCAGAKCECGRA